MGSVIDYNKDCPRCKQENCIYEFWYKTGEEFFHCPDCGYHREFRYKRGEDGMPLRKDENKDFDFDNLIAIGNSRQAVGDNQDSSPFKFAANGRLNSCICLDVN